MKTANECVDALHQAFTFGAGLIIALNLTLPYEWRKYALKWNGELARYADHSRGGIIAVYGKKSAFVDEFMQWPNWCDFWRRQGFKVVDDPAQMPEGADFKLQPARWRSKKPLRSLLKQEEETIEFMKASSEAMRKMAQDIDLKEQEQDPTPLPLFDNGLPAEKAESQQSEQPPSQGHDQ